MGSSDPISWENLPLLARGDETVEMQLLSFPWERCGSYESAISPFGRMRMAGAKRVGPDQWTDRSIGSGGENRGLTSRQARPVHWTLCLHRIGGAQTITELPIHFL